MKIGPLEINFRRLGIFVIIGLVLILVMNFNTRLGELAVLQTQVAEATSSDAVDAFPRGEAHMGMPGDNVIVVMPVAGATPEPTPTPTPAVNDLSTWQVWMLFIFGK